MKDKLKQIFYFFSSKRQSLFLEYKTDFKPRYGSGKPPHDLLYKIIDKNRETYKILLHEFLQYKDFIQNIKKSGREVDSKNPEWNNGYLPGLDIIALYSLISKYKPKRYLEIGSGNSTKVANLARTEQKFESNITSIDPFPRAAIKGIADQIINKKIEDSDLKNILELEENDILFIDNSHRVLPNSDATVVFMDILPYLRPGVIVHIHDIYLPYDYPQFMCDRYYSEQYVLAAMIMANPKRYHTIMPNFFVSEDPELSKILNPIWNHENLEGVERHGGSFWFRIA